MDVGLQDVLIFFTAAEKIPPCGFDCAGTLAFNDDICPTASTCSLLLTLPSKYDTYSEFKTNFIYALCNYGGFGLC